MPKRTFIDNVLSRVGLRRLSQDEITQGAISKDINPFTGLVSGNYWQQTGMPWVSSEGRKAVLTEWFWQPIRGQPRRADTNELRRFSQTHWIYACVTTIINEIVALKWDIVPREGIEVDAVKAKIEEVKNFLRNPNHNHEPTESILRATLKDILEIDAGTIVKVFDISSYDFEHLEPKSGAPLLKPLICPECEGGQADRALVLGKYMRMKEVIEEWRGKEMGEDVKAHNISGGTLEGEIIISRKEKWDETWYGKQADNTLNKLAKITLQKDFLGQSAMMPCPFCNGTGKGRHLTEIYARDGASFLKEVDKFGFAKGYWQYSYQIPAHPMWFNREELIYISQYPRSSSCYGYAPTQAILDVVKSLHWSVIWNRKYFEENAIPEGIVGLPDMNTDELKRFREFMQAEIQGKPHKLAYVNADAKLISFRVANRELEFLQTQQWYFRLIVSMFQLTPSELGMTDDVNKATASTQAEVLRRKGLRPLIRLIEYCFNSELIPEFGTTDVEFKFIEKDLAEERAQVEVDQIKINMGVLTPDEVRIADGKPALGLGRMYPMSPMQQAGQMGQRINIPTSSSGMQSLEREEQEVFRETLKPPQATQVGWRPEPEYLRLVEQGGAKEDLYNASRKFVADAKLLKAEIDALLK